MNHLVKSRLKGRRDKKTSFFRSIYSSRYHNSLEVLPPRPKKIVDLTILIRKPEFTVKIFEEQSEEEQNADSTLYDEDVEERILLKVPPVPYKQKFTLYVTQSALEKLKRMSDIMEDPAPRIVRYLLGAWVENPRMFSSIENLAKRNNSNLRKLTKTIEEKIKIKVQFELGEYKRIKDTSIARNVPITRMLTQLILACVE